MFSVDPLSGALSNQHAVPVTVEAIAFLYRVPIGRQDCLAPGECRHQHQQSRARKVEVGQELIHERKAVAGANENFRFSAAGSDLLGQAAARHRFLCGIFQGPDHRGADRQNRALRTAGLRYSARSRGRYLVGLGVHRMLAQVLDVNRLEGSQADLQRNFADFRAPGAYLLQGLLREVQSGGWRCHGHRPGGKDGLVALLVGWLVASPDVGGQRYVAGALNRGENARGAAKANLAQAVEPAPYHLGLQFCPVDTQSLAAADLASGAHQGLPQVIVQATNQEQLNARGQQFPFHGRVSRLVGRAARAVGKQSRRNHAGIVDDHEFVATHPGRQVREERVPELACVPVELQHS